MTMILIIIYNIYIKRSSQSLQVDGRKWSCKSVSAVTGRRAVLYKMVLALHILIESRKRISRHVLVNCDSSAVKTERVGSWDKMKFKKQTLSSTPGQHGVSLFPIQDVVEQQSSNKPTTTSS